MGTIAAAGLVAGLGKGLVANAEVQVRKDFAALEEAKEIRLRQLDAQYRTAEQDKQIQASKDLETQRQAGQATLQTQQDKAAGERNDADLKVRKEEGAATRAVQVSEGEKNRKSAEKIADTRRDSNIRRTFKPEKFTTSTVKASTIGKDGVISEIETLAVTRGGQTFVQLGQNFVPYQAGKPAAEPTFAKPQVINEAIKRIKPGNAEEFLRLYGFIPAQYIKYIAQGNDPYGNQPDAETEEEE